MLRTNTREREHPLMLTGQHASPKASSDDGRSAPQESQAQPQSQELVLAPDHKERAIALKTIVPAVLPSSSRAAASQRLNDRPLNNIRGVYYPVPHNNP